MKRYIYILFIALTSSFVWSCVEEEAPAPVYKDAGTLEVSFTYNEATAKSITLAPAFQTIEVSAALNHDDVKWNVVSDKDWCLVDDVIHEGSGTFEVTVVTNESYDDREPATVSLCAGEYKASLRVTQLGNVFKVDEIFGLGQKKAGSAEILVKTAEGVEWTTRQPDWITVDKETVSTANGETQHKMTVQWEDNASASRLGVIELCRAGEDVASSKYALWQFGDGEEYDFEADGNIRIVSRPSAEIPLEIRTPSNHIEALKYPQEWVQMEKIENEDNTTSWMLYFGENPSDCNNYRETQLVYTTLGDTEGKPLSVIYQDYYPVGGLISAKGFAMFAEKFNAGEDVSNWVDEEGVVNVLSNVDMSALESTWVPVGTEETPFNLKFNGNKRTISGFASSAPLFGVCDGAEIFDVVMDETCSVAVTSDFNANQYLSALVGKLANSTVSGCSSAAVIELKARAVNNSEVVYAGGLVAYAGEGSVITGSDFSGSLDIAVTRTASSGSIYIGGVAGYSTGVIKDCENAGNVSDNSISKYHYTAGITGVAAEQAEIEGCVNFGTVYHASNRNVDGVSEINRDVYLAGIVARNYGALKNLENKGSVETNSSAKTIYLGGVAGRIEAGTVEKCHSTAGAVSYGAPKGTDNAPANLGRYVYVGGVIGSSAIALELDYSGTPVICDLTFSGMDGNGDVMAGGIIGIAQNKLTLTSPKWEGSIRFNMPTGTTTKNRVCIGGIVGMTSSTTENIVITGAETSGSILTATANTSVWKAQTAIGGIIGRAVNGLVLSGSLNSASLGWNGTTGKSNDSGVVSSGGLVGQIDMGKAEISNCTNKGSVNNRHYHNNKWNSGKLLATKTGGIIGTYGYVSDFSAWDFDASAITITDCHTESEVIAYRGLVGGIAGYLYNAKVSGCTYTGGSTNKGLNCNVGGIAGAVEKTSISDSDVIASLYGVKAGSCQCKVGGIAAYLYTGSSISDCRYFGHITTGDNGTEVVYFGGIVAEAQEDCSVTGCAFGGSIIGVTITAENYAGYIIGNNAITATNCSYWDGQ